MMVNEPAPLSNLGTLINDITCHGAANGSIFVNIEGGVSPYSYLWSDGQTTASASGLIAGTYDLSVTDANGCTFSVNNIVVSEPAPLANTLTTVVNASCFGTCDGSITVNVIGGAGPYTYAWSEIFINQINGDGTPTVTDLCKGLYSVTVTDANGCTIVIDSIEVTEPTPMFNNNMMVNNITCNGLSNGSIDLDIFGGQMPYTYAWDNGDTTEMISDLDAGSYSVTVTDASGCTFNVNNVVVTEPAVLENLNTTITDISCNATCDGGIQLQITGGTLPYTYAWNNGANTPGLSNVCEGTYNVTITDANGCTITENGLQISEPMTLALNLTGTNISCYSACDGSVDALVTGGTMPYAYSWNTGQITANLANLCNDTYSISITDANGCSITDSIVITQPEEFKVSTTSLDVSCFGSCDGNGTAITTGGVMPYTYSWSNGDSVATITNLCAGTYDITINDANNCIVASSVLISEPAQIQIQLNVDYTLGSITAVATNGQGPYTYSWNTGSTGSTISNLTDGTTYIVTATDFNGCSETDSVLYMENGGIINQFTVNVGAQPI